MASLELSIQETDNGVEFQKRTYFSSEPLRALPGVYRRFVASERRAQKIPESPGRMPSFIDPSYVDQLDARRQFRYTGLPYDHETPFVGKGKPATPVRGRTLVSRYSG